MGSYHFLRGTKTVKTPLETKEIIHMAHAGADASVTSSRVPLRHGKICLGSAWGTLFFGARATPSVIWSLGHARMERRNVCHGNQCGEKRSIIGYLSEFIDRFRERDGITGVYGPPIFGQLQSLSTITNLTLTLIFSLLPI